MFFIFFASGALIFLFSFFKFWENKRQKITKISRFFANQDYFLRRLLQKFLVSWRSIKRSLRLLFLVEIPFMVRKIVSNVQLKLQKRFDKIKDDIRGKYLASHRVKTSSKYLTEISQETKQVMNRVEGHSNQSNVVLAQNSVVKDVVPHDELKIGSIINSVGNVENNISVKELIAIKKISTASALRGHKRARGKEVLSKAVTKEHDTSSPVSVVPHKTKRRKKIKNPDMDVSPVLVRTHPDSDVMSAELVIIENLRRGYLDPVARAKAFYKLSNEFNLNHTKIAEQIGKSREHVSNTLRILALPEVILDALKKGKITEGHTRPLLMLHSRPTAQESLFKEIVAGDLTVREAETISRRVASDRIRKKS